MATSSILLDWVTDPPEVGGLHELEGDSWGHYPFSDLAQRIQGVSAQLTEAGVTRNDVVAITADRCVDFAPALFGVLHAGGTPLPLAPAPASARAEADRVAAAILESVCPRLIAASGGALERAKGLRGAAGIQAGVIEVSPDQGGEVAPAPPAELALLQFTSGSTGRPRGVKVSHSNLEANVGAIRKWLDWDGQIGGVSWLPLQHDMGLIGMVIVALTVQRDLWQMNPAEFLVDPLRWLERFGKGEASITAAPTFGYSYVARRVRPEQLEGLDFSGWQSAVVGAERVIPEVLRDFSRLLGDFGFRPDTLRPAYGMAEGTLAISGHPRGSSPRGVRVLEGSAAIGQRLSITEEVPVTDADGSDDGTAEGSDEGSVVVSCGPPLEGFEISVVAEDERPLPEGSLGEIRVEGPSVAAGYHGDAAGVSTRFSGRHLLTGDAGFMHGGEVYVLGRIADSLKVRGTYVHVEDLEIAVAAALGIPLSRIVVVSAAGVDTDTAAVLIEADEDALDRNGLAVALRPALGAGVAIEVYLVQRNGLVRTTSGKPRRRLIGRMLAAGELDGKLALRIEAGDAADRELARR